ncbi:MAG: class I SAM-dependent methyltransferase [Dehalococcoidales bacterium]|nr:MAG: class I SAM-dependent methyltransferase [Dehalococcoidales bacterium]
MIDDVSDIRSFYDRNVENEHGRLERHPVERDVTWRFLDKYLPSSGKILDIGAATGAYTIPLARKGYSVTAMDFAPNLMQRCTDRIRELGLRNRVTCLVADARDLSQVTDNDFDAVLLMGPMYHLVDEEDRNTALKEAHQRMKPGGIIFSAFISRYGFWSDIMRTIPHYIENTEDVRSILEGGKDLEKPSWGPGGFRGYFATVPEIYSLHEQKGFQTIAVAGVEPAGIAADEQYKKLTDIQRELWLDLMVEISTKSSLAGASCHILYVGKKAD